MIDVYNNKNYLNYDLSNKVDYSKIKAVQNTKQNISSKVSNSNASSDSIEITQKDQNIINAKKAKDAFFETCSDFGSVNSKGSDMSSYYCMILDMMKRQGIDTSSFSLGSSSFVDSVKEFEKKVDMEKPGVFPSNFSDFCDAYKQKLIQCGL
ncbi:hypothetical protein [Clostridium sp. AWRP]|uniref:hypothetical protein n=1 Tax=Clostridium sp. AWRP TaxID=2212991 RepID=UPI000FDA3E79|nr:hypothetical protein [Clostridium sp. AWRP]AZV56621.1 hypothetical protein DMR38_08390 [Clostridium sp. AWRP]